MNSIDVARRRMKLIDDLKMQLLALCSPKEAEELEKILANILEKIKGECQ